MNAGEDISTKAARAEVTRTAKLNLLAMRLTTCTARTWTAKRSSKILFQHAYHCQEKVYLHVPAKHPRHLDYHLHIYYYWLDFKHSKDTSDHSVHDIIAHVHL